MGVFSGFSMMVGWSEVCYWHLGDGEGLGMLNHPVVGRLYIEELSDPECQENLLRNPVRGKNVGIGIRIARVQISTVSSVKQGL